MYLLSHRLKNLSSVVLAVPVLLCAKAVCAAPMIVDVPDGGVLPDVSPEGVFNALIFNAVLVLGGIATLMVIYGGYIILMHGDNETEVKKGKTIITYAVVGIIVIALAASIVKFALEVIN